MADETNTGSDRVAADEAQLNALQELSEKTVDHVKGELSNLSDSDLTHLRGMETAKGKDKSRSTLLAAIDDEITRRADAGSFNPEGATESTPGAPTTPVLTAEEAKLLSRAQANADAIGLIAALFGDDVKMIDGEVDTESLYAHVETLNSQLALAKGEAERNAKRIVDLEQEKALGKPHPTPVADVRSVATIAAPGTMTLILLDGGEPVGSVPPIPVEPEHFYQRGADTAIYQRRIALAAVGPAYRVDGVALAIDGEIESRCQVIPPMDAGGGRSVELQDGTLMFRREVPADAKVNA